MGALMCTRSAAGLQAVLQLPPSPPPSWAVHEHLHAPVRRVPASSLLAACLRALAEQPERFMAELSRLPQARQAADSARNRRYPLTQRSPATRARGVWRVCGASRHAGGPGARVQRLHAV